MGGVHYHLMASIRINLTCNIDTGFLLPKSSAQNCPKACVFECPESPPCLCFASATQTLYKSMDISSWFFFSHSKDVYYTAKTVPMMH